MSEPKWVNRNVRGGKTPIPGDGSDAGYRRDYVHKRSTRPLPKDTSKKKHKARRRRRFLRQANRLSVIGVLLVCALTIAAVWAYLRSNRQDAPIRRQIPDSERLLAADSGPEPVAHNPGVIVEEFLHARSVEEIAKLGRMDDNSPALIREFGDQILEWNKGRVQWTGLHEAKANGLNFSTFDVEHASEPKRILYVVQTPFGPRIDIGAFLGWSSESWDNLATGKATRATTVRAKISRVPYYNFRYTDENAWQSYRLSPLDDSTALYGYAARGSNTARALELLLANQTSFLAIVSLDEGEAGSDKRQFRISRVLAAGWIMGPDILEENLPQLIERPTNHPTPPPAQDRKPD